MPDYFTIQDKSYTIKYEHEHLKHAKLTNDSSQSELNTSLQYVFTVSDKIIMILDRYMMTVYKRIGGQYLFFDSHSRNEYGLVAGEGTSVALIFDSFQNLLNYLVQLIHSLRSRFFALLPVVVTVNSNTELSQESVHANNRSETDIAGCSTWNDIQLITGSNDLSSNSTDVTTPSDEQISSNQRQSVRTGLESNANQLSFDQTTLRREQILSRKRQLSKDSYQNPEIAAKKRKQSKDSYQNPVNVRRKRQQAKEAYQNPEKAHKKRQQAKEAYQNPEKAHKKRQQPDAILQSLICFTTNIAPDNIITIWGLRVTGSVCKILMNKFQIDRSNSSLIQSAYNQVPDNAKRYTLNFQQKALQCIDFS